MKRVFRKFYLEAEDDMSIQSKIDKFLIHQRNTICTSTSKTPAELIFSYKPRILLDVSIQKKTPEKINNEKNDICVKGNIVNNSN